MLIKIFCLFLMPLLLCSCAPDKSIKDKKTSNSTLTEETLNVDVMKQIYVGRYVLRRGLYTHDPFILNHLTRYNNQSVKWDNKEPEYQWFDVYCSHNHANDQNKIVSDVHIIRFDFEGYVVPLDNTGKPLERTVIVATGSVSAKGAFGYSPKTIKSFDLKSKKKTMETIANYFGGEVLYYNTAIVDMLNKTHPQNHLVNNVKGYARYTFE